MCNLPHPPKLPAAIGSSFWVTFRSGSYVWCLNCPLSVLSVRKNATGLFHYFWGSHLREFLSCEENRIVNKRNVHLALCSPHANSLNVCITLSAASRFSAGHLLVAAPAKRKDIFEISKLLSANQVFEHSKAPATPSAAPPPPTRREIPQSAEAWPKHNDQGPISPNFCERS